MAFMLTFEQHY